MMLRDSLNSLDRILDELSTIDLKPTGLEVELNFAHRDLENVYIKLWQFLIERDRQLLKKMIELDK